MKSTGTVKRALSGVMALLTVGAYALPAEIGSFLAVSNAVTASAAAKDIASGNVDASGLSYGDILRKGVVVVASGGPYVSRNGGTSFVHSGGDIMSFDAKVESLEYRSGKKEGYYLIISVYHGYLEDAYLTVDTENGTTSVRIGSVTVPESEYDVTYGTSAETAAAEFPTAPGEYYAFVTAKDTSTRYSGSKQSAAFTVEGEPEPPDYLKFTAEEDGSSVTFNYYQGTFQYSADAVEWTDLTHETAISLDEGDSVYFRGSGNNNLRLFSSGINSHLKISGKAACSGNIMTLLDYEHPDEAQMGESCFDCMFSGCTGLTKAPELPATALADYCYSEMFYNCTSLTEAPELPATTLADSCYCSMFDCCIGLTEAPELPATTLANKCYYRMFNRCTGISLSETQTEEYKYAYRVPSAGEGTSAANALTEMFEGTGGTFSGTPGINTTYYMKKSAEFTAAPSAAITGAVTVTGLQKLLRFSYVSNYKGEAVCGVLIKRDAVAELLTEETASADKQLEGAEDFFRVEDTGKGITLRPYVEVENVRCYGEQVYYTFDDVDMAEGTAKITGAAVYNANTGKIDFTYAAFYEGEGTVTYGVLIKRGLEEGVKLTRALAAADYPLSSAEAVFRSQDKGAGITLRPYIEIDGERKYGEQVTYYLSELVG